MRAFRGAGPYRLVYFHDIGYRPRRPSQAEYHKAATHCRTTSLFTFPRLGKSRCAAAEVGATWQEHDYHCWIVAPKYPLGAKEFGYVWEDHARVKFNGKPLLDMATRKVFNIQGGDMEIRYPWGWYLQVRTADNPADLLGDELDEVILAEGAQIAESVWDRFLYARVNKRKGRTHVPTTPKGQNWLFERFYLPGRPRLEDAINPAYDRTYWSATVSALWGQQVGAVTLPKCGDLYQPGVYDDETMATALRQGMPMEVFLEQFGGQFVSYAGLVYKTLNRVRHGCPPREIPRDWDLVIGIDPGAGADPTAIVFGAWDRQEPRHFWVWDLVYEHGRPVQFYADAIHRRLAGRRPYAVVVDTAEKQFRIELGTGHGLGNVAPHSRQLQDRYVAVSSLIGTNRIHIFDTEALRPFWDETMRYTWKEGAKGEITYAKTMGPDHCFDQETDVLTEDGWMPWPLYAGQRVAVRRPDGTLHFSVPTRVIRRPYRGPMVQYAQRNAAFCVTPDHHLFVADQYSVKRRRVPRYRLARPADLRTQDRVLRVHTGDLAWPPVVPPAVRGRHPEALAWMRFLGFWIAEGCLATNHTGRQFVRVSNRVAALGDEITGATGWRFTRWQDRKHVLHWQVESPALYSLLKPFSGAENKRIPVQWSRGTSAELRALLVGYLEGDGTRIRPGRAGRWAWGTTISRGLADDLQALCFYLGIPTTLYPVGQGRRLDGGPANPVWRVSFSGAPLTRIEPRHLRTVPYDGTVYCVTTREGIIATRRHGRIMWSGNCMDAWGYAVLVPGPWHDTATIDPLSTAARLEAGQPPLSPAEAALWRQWDRTRTTIQAARESDMELTGLEVSAFAEDEEETAEVWG